MRTELGRIADVQELVHSLGYRCGVSTKRVPGRTEASSTAFTLTFSTSDEVFRLSRKHQLHKERHQGSRNNRVRVINPDGTVNTVKSAGPLMSPTRLAFHPAGWLYVKDASPDGVTALTTATSG